MWLQDSVVTQQKFNLQRRSHWLVSSTLVTRLVPYAFATYRILPSPIKSFSEVLKSFFDGY